MKHKSNSTVSSFAGHKLKAFLAGNFAVIALGLLLPSVHAGTWTQLANPAPANNFIITMVLLSDGTVMAQPVDNNGSTIWYKLTPNSTGHYTNGVWTTNAPMHDGRLYCSSIVLKDGRLFVAGGEYGSGGATAEIYDPVTNGWAQINPPTSLLDPSLGQKFADSSAKLLPDGRVLVYPISPHAGAATLIYSPFTNGWAAGPAPVDNKEATWVKLPDDSILTLNADVSGPGGQTSQRYIPSTGIGSWINDAAVPVDLYAHLPGYYGEIGSASLLANGKVIYMGGSGRTALYTPSGTTANGSWVAGPSLPAGMGMADTPGAVMVNGKVLCVAGTNANDINHVFDPPTRFFEYDPVTNGFAQITVPGGGTSINQAAFPSRLLDLPDGSVLFNGIGSTLYIYQPDGAPLAAGKPTINSITVNGDGSLHLSGTLFNGISEGASYGDDAQMDSNFPLVRFTSGAGTVRYGRSYNWSRTSVATGNAVVTAESTVPAGASLQDTIQVVANGNASDGYVISTNAVVTTLADSGAGSLRQAILNLVLGGRITFAANLSGQSITLTSGELLLNKNLAIDASALPRGIAINGNHAGRILNVPGGSIVVLDSLTLTNGSISGNGGAINNASGASLTVNRCTVAGNTATGFGGAIENNGALTLNQSTLAGNSCSSNGGGAIDKNGGTVTVNQSTITGNSSTGSAGAGGIWGSGSSIYNSIVAGNSCPPTPANDNFNGSFIGTGVNLTSGNPQLAPLGFYGGPTPTMPPQPGSPAIDTAGTSSFTTDQRGFPRPADGNGDGIAVADIGAVELNVPLSVLVIWDINTGGTLALSNALANAGLAVTLSATDETGYTGANPSPNGFKAVIHLNGTTFATDMPLAGQITLSNYVANGGGYIQNEWDAYEYGLGSMANMRDLILFDRTGFSGPSLTLTTVVGQAGHPVLASIPSSITFQGDANSGSAHVFASNPVTVLMRENANDAVAVRQFGAGRVVGFSHAGNYDIGGPFNTLSDANVQQLYINAVNWSAKSVLTVVNTLDSGVGSLRQTVSDAVAGNTIRFAPYLSGSNIVLASGQVVLDKNLTIDASALPGGIKIDGNNASRIFQVNGGVTAVLNSLTIANGIDTGAGNDGGGGILSYGTLTLNNCTVAGNSASQNFWGGGGILSYNSALTINQSTVSGNSANNGAPGGGIITYGGTMTINQSTVSGNSASGGAGGIDNGGTLTLNNSIVAGNTSDSLGSFSGANNLTSGSPMLAPLGNYGGPTLTMLPLPGSPAIDAGGISSFITDQRGFARVVSGASDIGAVESGNTIPAYAGLVTTNTDTFDGIDTGGVSLREAVVLSAAGSTVTFAPNLSGAIITLTNGQLTLDKNLNIDASALPAGIQVDGNHASRVFEVNGGTTCVLTALTITNAYIASGFGAGIESVGNLTLNNCRLVGNQAGTGSSTAGGMAAYFGSLTMNRTTVSGNLGDNVAGIYLYGEQAVFRDCTISGNSGTFGEGLRVGSSTVALINSTVSGNTCNVDAAGIRLETEINVTCSVALSNCTVVGNHATSAGQPAGIWLAPVAGGTNRLTLYNTIVSGNTSSTAAADLTGTAETNSAFNLIGTGGGLINGVNGNQVGINNPLLGSLANNGGPTLTMQPLLGSPAIDAGGATALAADQRGLPRVVGPTSDVGAVELQVSPIVLTSADAGYGSLRYAITYNPAGSSLTFDPSLSGQRITLTSGELVLNKNLTIDGSALPGGITLDGNHTDRVFYVASGSTVLLDSLTISNGFYNGVSPGSYGGGIENLGALTINRCTLTGNSAGSSFGGAIENQGGLTLSQSTLTGNSAQGGGGIASQAPLVVNQSTIAGNSGGGSGGIICGASTTAVTNSIVAGNGSGNISGPFAGANNLTSGNPLLAPLGNYGGPTPSMPPFPGSPAVDAGGATSFATDQRGSGFPRVINGAADIGAVEGVFNPPIALTSPTRLGNGAFQFGFTNYSGLGFTVLASTNLTLPLGSWTVLGASIEVTPGQYQFTDPQATNSAQRFYRVHLP